MCAVLCGSPADPSACCPQTGRAVAHNRCAQPCGWRNKAAQDRWAPSSGTTPRLRLHFASSEILEWLLSMRLRLKAGGGGRQAERRLRVGGLHRNLFREINNRFERGGKQGHRPLWFPSHVRANNFVLSEEIRLGKSIQRCYVIVFLACAVIHCHVVPAH